MTQLMPDAANAAVGKFGLMAFFPSDPDTRAALVWALMQFVEYEEQLDWLVEATLKLYSRWPGVSEVRAVYCSRYRPKDGAEVYSEVYVNGFPHESGPVAPAPLPPGRSVTADPQLDAEVRAAGSLKSMPTPKKPPAVRITPAPVEAKRDGSTEALGADPRVREKIAALKTAMDPAAKKRLAAELDLLLATKRAT